jgi:ATPase family AAA domain-containing protein 2
LILKLERFLCKTRFSTSLTKKALQTKDTQILDFDSIAGFDDHIMALKEMVGLPLMYPQVFSTFRINPPRGKYSYF